MTPLLRRLYLLLAVLVSIYAGGLAFEYSSFNKERLYRRLLTGDDPAKASAGFDLAYLGAEKQLIRALQSTSPQVRFVAASSVWDLWARAGGHWAFRELQVAARAVDRKAYPEALRILTGVTERYPYFAEGWNRRATLYWQLGRFQEAIADASRVVALNPKHFGAWQGLGLCHAHLGEFEQACRCMREALRITPHDQPLWKLLRHCEGLLDQIPPAERVRRDLI